MKKTIVTLIIIILTSILLTGCSEKNILNEMYPAQVKALFMGVERATLTGKFSQGGFHKLKELFTTTEFEKHKARVIEKLNELKGAFAETIIMAEKVYELYQTHSPEKRIFSFYRIEGLDFKKVPYLMDIQPNGVDRSFEEIKSRLESHLVLEVRPVILEYVESGDSMNFNITVKVILFDLKAGRTVFSKEVKTSSKITEAFYREEALRQGEQPTPGFQKIKVTFNIDNYKEGIRQLAMKLAPEVTKILLRGNK